MLIGTILEVLDIGSYQRRGKRSVGASARTPESTKNVAKMGLTASPRPPYWGTVDRPAQPGPLFAIPGAQMRKLQTLIAGASAAAVLALACPSATAQTTFAATNDPSTSLRVERHATDGTLVVLTRARSARNAMPFTTSTVLRDPASGISYELREHAVAASKDGRLEIVTARFRPLDPAVVTFDLIDPVVKQRALYITRIETEDALIASTQ